MVRKYTYKQKLLDLEAENDKKMYELQTENLLK